jgi:putative transposase
MGRPLRHQDPDGIYFLTNRCTDQKYLMKASEDVNRIILGLLAKYADKHDIEIFAFVFMFNHYHMLARSQALKMHLFMKDFQGQLARKLNHLRRRTGSFWQDRYTATRVLDDEALVDKLKYTICNPCESNLVRHPKLWEGLNSYSIHKSGDPMVGEVVDRKLYWSLRRKRSNKDLSEAQLIEMATKRYELKMAKLPKWKNLSDEAYDAKICELVEEHALDLAEARNVPCLGLRKVRAVHFTDRPRQPKKSPRPVCHTHCAERREAHIAEIREITDRYRKAIGKLRENKTDVSFPSGTIPPGHQLCA